jgi:hypothetical protein
MGFSAALRRLAGIAQLWRSATRLAVIRFLLLDGIPLGDIANRLRPNLDLSFGSAGGKRRGVLGITDP